jgi:transposase
MVMKVYSPEFKADAVALYLSDPSHTFEGIGTDLGISRETLRNWVRTDRARHGGGGTTTTSTEKNTVGSPPTAEELQAEAEGRTSTPESAHPPSSGATSREASSPLHQSSSHQCGPTTEHSRSTCRT